MAKFMFGIETVRYCTVTVEAETEAEAKALAVDMVVANHKDVDWNPAKIDYIDLQGTYEEPSPLYDTAYEDRKEGWAA